MIYQFQIILKRGYYMTDDTAVERIIDVDETCTLYSLCHALLNSIDFDFDHCYEFIFRKESYQGTPMGSEGKDPRLASLGLRKGSKLQLIYDFGDWWVFDFKVVERREGTIPQLTEVVDSVGNVQQYPDFDECNDGSFYDYKSESDYQALNPAQRQLADALYDIDRLTLEGEELQAAEQMLSVWPKLKAYVLSLSQEPGTLTVHDVDPTGIMNLWNAITGIDIPFLNQKKYEEGIRLWRDILQTFRWDGEKGDSLKGAIGEALAQMKDRDGLNAHFNLWRMECPDSVSRMNYHLLALEDLEDWEAAKEPLEEYLAVSGQASDADRLLLFQRAAVIYEKNGDTKKAEYYNAELRKLAKKLNSGNPSGDLSFTETDYPMQVQTPYERSEAKIYPNDPCPCGSGKKYKKCCGR